MLHRSSKIIVVESSASKNAHPNIGDVGYLNNIYLFPSKRFILADAFFYQYKKDVRKNINRLEKKSFLIDLGMSSSLKYDIKRKGVTKSYLANNSSVVNLTPLDYIKQFRPHVIGPDGIWTKLEPSKTLIKIPFIHISDINSTLPKRRLKMSDTKEISAWYACSTEIVRIAEAIDNLTSKSARNYIHSCTKRHLKKTREKDRTLYVIEKIALRPTLNNFPPKNEFIKCVRLLTVLHKMWRYRMVNRLLNNVSNFDKDVIAEEWSKIHIFNDFNLNYALFPSITKENLIEITNYIRSLLFQAIMTSPNTHQDLKIIKEFLPPTFRKNVEKFCSFCDIIKADAHSSSAALTRIFDAINEIEGNKVKGGKPQKSN